MNRGVVEEDVILIVDDTPMNLDVLLDLLEAAGFKVVVAEDGESAIALIEYAPPDSILPDILMPGIDGFETCRPANPAVRHWKSMFLLLARFSTVNRFNSFVVELIDLLKEWITRIDRRFAI